MAPVEVGALLHDKLYPRYHSLFFTSATLDSEDNFAWIKARLGLTAESEIEAQQFKLPSPFPLKEQLKLLLARFLPPPNHPEYVKRLGKLLSRIVKQNPLPTLVLCTSYRMVEDIAGIMAKAVDRASLLVQRSDIPAQTLLNRFRRQKRGVLIGTESFWEGIDLPGELLRLLILTRMPFAVPDDPLEQARQEKATQAGESAFMTVSIPAAVLKYRQGIGRMIRSASDWGAVIVTDSRMGRKRYGQIFLAASPVEVDICDQEVELSKAVEIWFAHHRENQN
jgi:ATP-dependent DNA helicase DinG